MSNANGQKEQEKTNDGKENTGVEDQDEKNKLLTEIRALRILIYQIENSFDTITFENVREKEIANVEETSKGHFNELVDVDLLIQNELYSYAGLCCKEMGERFVFAFQSTEKSSYSNENWIQLLKVEDTWQLGQWVMPLSVDIKAIIAKYSIDSAESMKLFLRECKHEIDCYHRREQEFRELKDFLEGLERVGCSVESNYGYTRIIIKLVKARCVTPDEARNILVYLIYKISEARPWKLQIDSDGENKLSDDETKDLRVLFKSLKEQDLKDAVEKILTSNEGPFAWKQAPENNSMIDINESEKEEVELSALNIVKKKPKRAKKQGKVTVETDKNESKVSEDDDRRENDFSIDAADRPNAQTSEEVASQVEIPKTGKKGSKRAKQDSRKQSLRKTKAKPKMKDQENISSNKSKTSRASGKKNLPLIHRNVSNTVDTAQSDEQRKSMKNDKLGKSIVPKMFKRTTRSLERVSEVNKEADTLQQKSVERVNNIGNRGRTPLNGVNSAVTSISCSHSRLMCSTPLVERTVHLSTVAEENITAIGTESTIITKGIAATERNAYAGASDHFDESDSAESNGEDVTKLENNHRELLKDLQAVKYKATATKKPVKRKAKAPAGGRKKIAHI